MSKKTAVSTALFGPEDSKYVEHLPDFLRAIERQTSSAFDVIFYAEPHLQETVALCVDEQAPSLNKQNRLILCTLYDMNGEPPNNLTAAVQRFDFFFKGGAVEDYSEVVLLDVDDIPANNHVETMVGTMDTAGIDIVAADVHVFGGKFFKRAKPLLSRRLKHGQPISYAMSVHGNCLAFSNVACKPMALYPHYEALELAPSALAPALDWHTFLPSLARGSQAIFTAQTHVSYRQHDQNLSGITDASPQKALENIRLKADFYQSVYMNPVLNPLQSEELAKLAQIFNRLHEQCTASERALSEYCRFVKNWTAKQGHQNFLWFETVVSPEVSGIPVEMLTSP